MLEKLSYQAAGAEFAAEPVEFAQYRNVGEAFEDRLYGPNMLPAEVTVKNGKVYGDQNLANLPERAVEYYGYDAVKQAIAAKQPTGNLMTNVAEQPHSLVSPVLNAQLIGQLRDSWFDTLVDAAVNDTDDNRVDYYSALNNTLDSLSGNILHPSSNDVLVPSLEASIEHVILHLTEVYLNRLHTGRLSDGYRSEYAKRVSLLNNIHIMAQQITSENIERTSA